MSIGDWSNDCNHIAFVPWLQCHHRQSRESNILDLNSLLLLHKVLFSVWNEFSFVLEGRRGFLMTP